MTYALRCRELVRHLNIKGDIYYEDKSNAYFYLILNNSRPHTDNFL